MSDWRRDQDRFGSRNFDQDRWRDDDHRSQQNRSDWDRKTGYGRDDDDRFGSRHRQDMSWSGQRDDWSTSDVARNRDRDLGRSNTGRSDDYRSSFGQDERRNDWRGGSSGDWRSASDYGNRVERGPDWSRGSFGGGFSRDEGRSSSSYGRGDWGRNQRSDDDRSFWDRATDEVSSWFGDRDAEQRRNMDELRSHRGRGPKGYARSDERIREDVSDRLSDDPRVDASEIEVTVASCEVTLTGTVDSREAKRRAEDCAESVSGVKHVQNNLRVQSWSAQSATGQGFGASTATGAGMTRQKV